MSDKNQSATSDGNKDGKPTAQIRQPAAPSVPSWRSIQIAPPREEGLLGDPRVGSDIPRPLGVAGFASRSNPEVIDKASYFERKPAARTSSRSSSASDGSSSNWLPTQLRPVPAFYPLERSSRLVEDDLASLAARLSEANRVLSVHAQYDNEMATASLTTAENVEMHLSLWKTGGPKQKDGILVELQRRKGDSIAFHRYSRYILDAAVGDFDPLEHVEKNGADLDMIYSRKLQGMLSLEQKQSMSPQDNAILALEIAHGLLMKDRMDARQLGLESLCLLTDPNKTGMTTALIASHVVLLGTAQMVLVPQDHDSDIIFDEGPFQEIRETVLSLIQLRRIGESEEMETAARSEEEEHITTLHNLALAVLANALDCIEKEESNDDEPEEIHSKPRSRTESSTSICESFLTEAADITNKEILSTLISELSKADLKPHNACLSAKSIGSLCRASEEARKRAKELGAKNVVQTALDVGTRTHLKLQLECEKVTEALTRVQEDENENRSG